MLPEKIRLLEVSIGDAPHAGQLLKTSTYEFRYLDPSPEQAAVAPQTTDDADAPAGAGGSQRPLPSLIVKAAT